MADVLGSDDREALGPPDSGTRGLLSTSESGGRCSRSVSSHSIRFLTPDVWGAAKFLARYGNILPS